MTKSYIVTGLGTYTVTATIEADSPEEAEKLFWESEHSDAPTLCWSCNKDVELECIGQASATEGP